MAKKRKSKKKNSFSVLKLLGTATLLILKSPYYFVKASYALGKKVSKKSQEIEVKNKRKSMTSKYEDFKVLKTLEGKYTDWQKGILKSDSKIGIILGARGTGKTALGIKLLENLHEKSNRKCYALGFTPEEMPSWINVVENVSEIKNNSIVLIDEGGILFSSRNSMSKPNKLLSQLILVARHKNLSILFISQNSSNLEVNILRQADFLILKPSSLLQKDFERKIIQKIYKETTNDFKKLKKNKGLTYIHSEDFRGFVNNSLPSFWKEGISKSFK